MEASLIPNKDQLRVMRVNSFTTKPFTGNPAGVVPDGDGLSDELMRAVAAELNDISETVFICTPDTPEAQVKLRYFTSTTEVDLCGHATVAALFALAWLGRLEAGTGTQWVKAQTRVGVLTLGLTFENGKPAWASMEQLAPQTAEATRAGLAAQVLGLPPTALLDDLPVGCASSGLWSCFVPLKSLSDLQQVSVKNEQIESLWPENEELTGVYPFVFLDSLKTQGRFFSPPKYGIQEDPVTGTASGALAAYLMAHGRMKTTDELLARQGFEMGRGGEVKVSCTDDGRMKIQGQAVLVMEGVVSGSFVDLGT